MHDQPLYVSKEGLEKLKEELQYLKTVKRREVTARIEKAKDLGDLRENADYHDAKDEAGWVNGRIIELEHSINRAVIIEGKRGGDSVTIGARVQVTYGDGKTKELSIVGAAESDPIKGLISNESPLGQALIGKKVGEVAEVKVPSGIIKYVIASIS